MAVNSLLHVILVLWLTKALAGAPPLEKKCEFFCGTILIPYPFGIGEGCYANKNFAVTCNDSTNPPTPFITSIGWQLLESSPTGYIRVNNPVIYSHRNGNTSVNIIDLSDTPFEYSSSRNRFTALGCENCATLVYRNGSIIRGRSSICSHNYGLDWCQVSIPPGLKTFDANMTHLPNNNGNGGSVPGDTSAFMVDQIWFRSLSMVLDDLYAVLRREYVPVTLLWAKYMGVCVVGSTNPSRTYCRQNGTCWTQLMQNVLCVCSPMSSEERIINKIQRCHDMSKCIDPTTDYYCVLQCVATPGGYDCSCPDGYQSYWSSSYNDTLCTKITIPSRKSPAKIIIIGCVSGLGSVLLFFGTWVLCKIIKRRRAVTLKQKFFERNGGLLLQQQLSSKENNVEQTKVFDYKELEKATDHYHVDRILGEGGQGTVYKGMLTDGRIVAVKKSKVIDEGRIEEFINEVVILSQINHRNVVKLLGCCLETEVPLLVYEFIPNGTLFQHLHNPNDEFPITWEMRLRIAAEAARAVSYLHSAATVPIFHRDIKSTNILLDEKYRARVSDFGTSRSLIAVDQTHLTTRVFGTFGYLDPEYFQSSQFTEKSDVYSFGVVLVELLTGQKPISVTRTEEGRSLATIFLLAMEEDRLFEIVDSRVLKEAKKEEIIAVAQLSRRCLNLNGKKRPNMRTVATELEATRASNGASCAFQEEYEEIDYSAYNLSGPPDSAFSSSNHCSKSSVSKSIDVEPLLRLA